MDDPIDTDHAVALERERIARWLETVSALWVEISTPLKPASPETVEIVTGYAAIAQLAGPIRRGDHWKVGD